ncbi:Xenobiotic-transporting ATPase [Rhodothermus marinus SG0.5JP17-172]|mgnify:FL=1|uniref:ABC transporter ATP-binding protein n=1 Tax=Rhodothermus marinus TaxID=29549 RepID=UPI000223D6F7|nr:ABC transporter ATP-binding protein [Rhodothermus marinus]AEN73808.1 Xenobiotic-transporting ATPase [Rhodothermus marinus SG0.5JP17-172]
MSWRWVLKEARLKTTYLVRALRLIWEATGRWTLLWLLLLLVGGVLPAALVYLTKHLVDAVAAAIGAGLSWETVQPVLWPALLMGGVLLLSQGLSGLTSWIRTAQAEHVLDHVKDLIHTKAAEVDLAFYDNPDYYDHLERANSEAASRSLSLLDNLGGLLQNGVTLVSIAAILVHYSVWLPLALLITTLPALFVVVHHHRREHAWWTAHTVDQRRAGYFDRLLTMAFFAPEVRVFDLADHFRQQYQEVRQRLREGRLDLMRRQVWASLGAGLVGLLATALVMVWMVGRALRGLASLGDLALFYQAFNQGQGLMRALLSSAGQMYANTLFLEHLFTFLEIQTGLPEPDDPVPVPRRLREGIRFEKVTFRYPDSERPVLRQLDLFIPAGRTVAIVGANGAGKSTLIKLLCRFYDPDEGRVTIDGIDLRRFRRRELLDAITVLFQFPVPYQDTLARNIALGDLKVPPTREAIERAARSAMVDEIARKLPHGYDTLLGKWFSEEGAELSGGEWQRVSLARAFYRQAPIVVLDEPTSAMDSWTEAEWMDRFDELVRGRTALIITHRFTTAMRADLIYVMDEGRVIEQGTHHQLLALNGHYAASWRRQMRQHDEPEASDLSAQVFLPGADKNQ